MGPSIDLEATALALVAHAAKRGIEASAYEHDRFGWSVWAETPFHDEPVRLTDRCDAKWLAAEMP